MRCRSAATEAVDVQFLITDQVLGKAKTVKRISVYFILLLFIRLRIVPNVESFDSTLCNNEFNAWMAAIGVISS